LSPGSPAIDHGWSALARADLADVDGDGDLTELVGIDLAGEPRFVAGGADGVGCGPTPRIDLGAYEFRPDGSNGAIPCLFDVDGDGMRGAAELQAVLASFGRPSGSPGWNCGGDVDFDLDVDLDDLLIALGLYGQTCSTLPGGKFAK
jgi:hypothetical protein